jgi:hypothetical protein
MHVVGVWDHHGFRLNLPWLGLLAPTRLHTQLMPSIKVGVAGTELVVTGLILDDDSLDLSDPILIHVTTALPILLTSFLIIIVVYLLWALRGDDRIVHAVYAAPGFLRVHDSPLGHLLRFLEPLTAERQIILLLPIGVLHLLNHLLIFPQVADEVLQALGFVLLVLPEQLLLIYQMILISPEPLNLLIELLELMSLLLLLHGDLIGLLRPRLLQLGQVSHQPVVLLLIKL